MNFLRKNLGIKILTLLGAVALWVYVVGTSDLIYQVPEEIPVSFFNLSEDTVIASDQNVMVKVAVKAPRKVWKNITSENLDAYVDLQGLLPGDEHKLDVVVSSDIAEVSVYRIDPEKITVLLDTLVEKEFPVTLKIEGQVDDNYSVGEPILSQSSVLISDAQTKVDSILEIRAPIQLSDAESGEVKQSVALVAVNQDEEVISDINIEPASIDVTIPIQEVKQSKTFGIKANYDPTQLDSDAWVKSVTIVPPTVELLGDSSVLDSVDIISTDKIDLQDVTGSVERRVQLNIPAGLTLADPLNPFVTVKFEVTDEQATRKIDVPVTVENLSSDFMLLNVSPATIEVEISAPKEVLKELQDSDVSIVIYASSYTGGEQKIEINEDSILLPDGADLIGFSPKEVNISIEEY